MTVKTFENNAIQAPLPVFEEWDTIPASNEESREADFYFSENEQPDMYDLIASDEPKSDHFYVTWEDERSTNTFAGIYLSDMVMANLLSILYGRGGYFMLGGMITTEGRGDESLVKNAENKQQRQLNAMEAILQEPLTSANVPAEEIGRKVDEIILDISEHYSGEANRKKRQQLKRRLGIGKVALSKQAA